MSHATLLRYWKDAQKHGLNKNGNWFKQFIKTDLSSTQEGLADDSFDLDEQEITTNNIAAFSYITAPPAPPPPPPPLPTRAEGKTSKQSGSAPSSPKQKVAAVNLTSENEAYSSDETGDLEQPQKASTPSETGPKETTKKRKRTTQNNTSSSTLLNQMSDGSEGTEQPGSRVLFVLC